MTAAATPAGPLGDLDSLRTGHWWQPFTGLVPVLIMVPILLLHAYAFGILVATVGSALVMAYHLHRGQGVTSLDALALGFAAANLGLYFGFDNTWLIAHLDAVFYALLAAQSAISLLAGSPWTTQFARRTVVPELWGAPAFRAMNTLTTALWATCFGACLVSALLLPDPTRVWAPVALMVATVAASRRLGRNYLAQRLAAERRSR